MAERLKGAELEQRVKGAMVRQSPLIEVTLDRAA